MSDYVNEPRLVKTTKRHFCRYCGAEIPKGTKDVLVESGFCDGYAFREWACPDCRPYLDDFWDWCRGWCEDDVRSSFEYYLEGWHPKAHAEMMARLAEERGKGVRR